MSTNNSQQTTTPHDERTWYSAAQLSERWGVNVMTVRRWRDSGKLKGHTLSRGVIRFALKDVLEFEREALSR